MSTRPKKPTILVSDRETSLPFDTAVIAHSFYQRDLEYNAIVGFVSSLSSTIMAVRREVEERRYVPFVENFRFETVAPSTVAVSAEQFYAQRLDDLSSSVRRIEQKLDEGRPANTRDWSIAAPAAVAQPIFQARPDAGNSPPAGPEYQVGRRVFHSKFGYGTIAAVEGAKVETTFERAGLKRVLHSFLRIVD